MGAIGSKGFMRGGNGQLSRFCNSMRINLQYTTGNLHAMLSVESVQRKKDGINRGLAATTCNGANMCQARGEADISVFP